MTVVAELITIVQQKIDSLQAAQQAVPEHDTVTRAALQQHADVYRRLSSYLKEFEPQPKRPAVITVTDSSGLVITTSPENIATNLKLNANRRKSVTAPIQSILFRTPTNNGWFSTADVYATAKQHGILCSEKDCYNTLYNMTAHGELERQQVGQRNVRYRTKFKAELKNVQKPAR